MKEFSFNKIPLPLERRSAWLVPHLVPMATHFLSSARQSTKRTEMEKQGKNVTCVYYTGLVCKLREAVKRKALRKVNTLGAALQPQCTSAHLPCCHGRYSLCMCAASTRPLSTTLFCRSLSIRFPTVQIFKGITLWACLSGR